MRESRLNGEEHRGEVGADDFLKVGECGFAERRLFVDARVGEQDVEPTKLVRNFDHGLFGCVPIRNIRPNREHAGAKLLGRGIQGLGVAADDLDPCALGSEKAPSRDRCRCCRL